jgi:hypothetical protein
MNDLVVSSVICLNESHVWFVAEHLTKGPLVDGDNCDSD